MPPIRQTVPGQFYQGEDEQKSYTIDVGNWFTSPTGASVVIKRSGSDVSASHLQATGSANATISGSLITTPCIVSLVAGNDYRVEVKMQESGEILETFFFITAET